MLHLAQKPLPRGRLVGARDLVPHAAGWVAEMAERAQAPRIRKRQRRSLEHVSLFEIRLAARGLGAVEADRPVCAIAERLRARMPASAQRVGVPHFERLTLLPALRLALRVGDNGLSGQWRAAVTMYGPSLETTTRTCLARSTASVRASSMAWQRCTPARSLPSTADTKRPWSRTEEFRALEFNDETGLI